MAAAGYWLVFTLEAIFVAALARHAYRRRNR